MKRGQIWTLSGAGGYNGKPRPVLIIQDDAFSGTSSVTVCSFTTTPRDAPFIRFLVEPSERNGLDRASWLMVDKIASVPRGKLGRHLGNIDDTDLVRFNLAALVFLGLVPARRRGRS